MYYASLTIDRRIDGKRPDGHPCHKVLPVDVENDKGLKVEIIQCSFLMNNFGYSMIRLTDLDGTHSDALKSDGLSFNDYGEYVINKISKNQYVAIVMNNNCNLAGIVMESGCFLTSAIPHDDNVIEWRVVGPHKTYIKKLVDRMVREGYGVNVNVSGSFDAGVLLSPMQEQYINTALERGYYDVPRTITLDELAEELGCSKSTLSVAMREAERKLIQHHVFFKSSYEK